MAVARSPATLFCSRKWVAAKEATWGRWVMQRTSHPRALLSLSPHHPRPVAPDSGVDLIEDKGRGPFTPAEPTERQHHTRELAARGGVTQRSRGSMPGFAATRSSTVSLPSAPITKPCGCGFNTTSSCAPGIASRSEALPPPSARVGRRPWRAPDSALERARPAWSGPWLGPPRPPRCAPLRFAGGRSRCGSARHGQAPTRRRPRAFE